MMGRKPHPGAAALLPQAVAAPPHALPLSFMPFRQKLILFHP